MPSSISHRITVFSSFISRYVVRCAHPYVCLIDWVEMGQDVRQTSCYIPWRPFCRTCTNVTHEGGAGCELRTPESRFSRVFNNAPRVCTSVLSWFNTSEMLCIVGRGEHKIVL